MGGAIKGVVLLFLNVVLSLLVWTCVVLSEVVPVNAC